MGAHYEGVTTSGESSQPAWASAKNEAQQSVQSSKTLPASLVASKRAVPKPRNATLGQAPCPSTLHLHVGNSCQCGTNSQRSAAITKLASASATGRPGISCLAGISGGLPGQVGRTVSRSCCQPGSGHGTTHSAPCGRRQCETTNACPCRPRCFHCCLNGPSPCPAAVGPGPCTEAPGGNPESQPAALPAPTLLLARLANP